jgi:hypothetical protein
LLESIKNAIKQIDLCIKVKPIQKINEAFTQNLKKVFDELFSKPPSEKNIIFFDAYDEFTAKKTQ